jgi:hypothetical protein
MAVDTNSSGAQTVKSLFDPVHLILKNKNEANIPDYQDAFARYSANQAAQLNDWGVSGRSTTQLAGSPYHTPEDSPIGGQSVLGLLGGPATAGDTRLSPYANGALVNENRQAQLFAGGQGGAQFGQNDAQDALNMSRSAAGEINPAGSMSRPDLQASLQAQQGAVNSYGQDLGIIRNSALGTGPSAAQALAKQQLDASIQAQASQAAQARGGNIAAGMRSAANAGTQIQLQGAQQMAAQRAQEQLSAQGLLNQGQQGVNAAQGNLTGAYGALRQQDIGQAQAAAGALQTSAGQQQQMYGQNIGLGTAGLTGLGNAAGGFTSAQSIQSQAELNQRQAYADWLQRQYSISSGLAPQYAGVQGNIAIANQTARTQQDAALLNAAGAAGAAYATGGASLAARSNGNAAG